MILLPVALLAAGCATQPAEQGPAEPAATSAEAEQSAEPRQQEEKRQRAEPVSRDVVKPSHPVRYTVRRGDTLWDIAAQFLRDPWVWPEIWSVNPQIENPHLIYPGDVITLAFVGGEPRLRVDRPGVTRDEQGREVVKLSPEVRERPLDEAIPAIPGDAIRQFLNRPRVVTEEQLQMAPYVLGNYEGRLISAAGNDVFARGFNGGRPDAGRYSVFRPGEPLTDPDSGEVLGYEAIHVGKAAVRDAGPPVRLQLTDTTREVLKGDRLLPASGSPVQARYIPQVPEGALDGRIIKLFDAISQVGTNQVVVLNLGQREDVRVGHVFQILQSGGTVSDPYAEPGSVEQVQLPAQRVGTLMVFKVFDRVSYALTLSATQAIRLGDRVAPPR